MTIRTEPQSSERLVARRPWKEPGEERQTQVFKIHGAEPREPTPKRLHARVAGFDLHASAPMEAHERIAIERFCRYALRGPIANGRLSKGPRDRVAYGLKAPRADGTTALVLSPMALLERLSRLIPQHGRNMVTYPSVLASDARWRPRIVPTPPPALPPLLHHAGSRRIDWADLLRRVFLLEVLACACGGTRRVISSVEEGPAARKILRHPGLPSEPPTPAPARIECAASPLRDQGAPKAPPRSRGWTPSACLSRHVAAGSPALAGMDPRSARCSLDRPWLPRARGDGPAHGHGPGKGMSGSRTKRCART